MSGRSGAGAPGQGAHLASRFAQLSAATRRLRHAALLRQGGSDDSPPTFRPPARHDSSAEEMEQLRLAGDPPRLAFPWLTQRRGPRHDIHDPDPAEHASRLAAHDPDPTEGGRPRHSSHTQEQTQGAPGQASNESGASGEDPPADRPSAPLVPAEGSGDPRPEGQAPPRPSEALVAVQTVSSAALNVPGSLSRGQKMASEEGEEAHCQMTRTEEVILKDKKDFIHNVSQFFNQEDISDVLLKVGDNSYFAHRFVLAKSSEVFRTMLYDKRYGQAGHPQIVLEESEECQLHFEAFLKFLYTAEVQISIESAVGILCLSDKYSVMSLKALCTQYMVENTRSPHVRNALNWYSWAKALHMAELIDSCSKTIAWNMEQLVALPEWLRMDIDFLADIISNTQLVISNEFVLYTAVERWLLHDSHLADLKENSRKLLPLVRFPQMMVQQLYTVETGMLATREDSGEEIGRLLNDAYRFRSLCPFQGDLGLSFKDHFYRPRNYKDLTVDTVRMQNTLRFGIQVDVRTYVGPVPSTVREGEWKITYRKANDSWTLQVYCHESAMVNGEARIQAALLISDGEDRVLQVEASEETVCSRGNNLTMLISLPATSEAKMLTVLIKPLPN